MKRYLAILTLLLAIVAGGHYAPAPSLTAQDAHFNTTATRYLDAFDAEYHLGLVAGDDSDAVATANTARLNDALDATWLGGSCDLRPFNDPAGDGPMLRPINFPGKTFFFKGELKTSARNGCGILAGVPPGYVAGNGESIEGGYGGSYTRFTRIDSNATTGRGILRMRGAGITVTGIQFNGQPLPTDIQSGTGPLNQYGILVEGRVTPASGKLSLRQVRVTGCKKGLAFINGYWNDSDVFTVSENHADESDYEDLGFAGCERMIWSNNPQAVWHTFRRVHVLTTASFVPTAENPQIVCDVEAGGLWTIDGLFIGPSSTTVLRVKDWSPNSSSFEFKNVTRDGGGAIGSQLYRLFEYAGAGDASFQSWRVRFTGHISDDVDFAATTAAQLRASLVYDPAELFKFTSGGSTAPCDDIWSDIKNMPVLPFTEAGYTGSSLNDYTWEAQTGPERRLVAP